MSEETKSTKIELTFPCCDGGSLKIVHESVDTKPAQDAFKAITNHLGIKTEFTPLTRKGGGGP